MGNLLAGAAVPPDAMTTERTGGVGLSHPTVVPADRQDGDHDARTDREHCPECGRPVADRDRGGR